MPDRALITGASGLLGRQVLQAFEQAGWEAFGTGFSRAKPPQIIKVDIQNEHEVVKVLDDVHPRVLVHCAADRQPDSCTKNPEGARMLNVLASENLARLCTSRNCFLIYISTDYVFPGQPGQAPYTAASKTGPTNIYGQTKLDGENAVLEASPAGTSVVLRVPVLYGPTEPAHNNKESAVNILMDALHKSQKEKVVMDDYAIRYPTNTEDVARVCIDIAKLYMGKNDKNLPRILQFSSEDRMTKYEIVQKFAEIMDLPVDNIVADAESGKKPAADGTLRPYDCHLSTQELKGIGVDQYTYSTDINSIAYPEWQGPLADVFTIVAEYNGQGPFASECIVQFCVQNHSASVAKGTFEEVNLDTPRYLNYSDTFNFTEGGKNYSIEFNTYKGFGDYFDTLFNTQVHQQNGLSPVSEWPDGASQALFYWTNASSDHLPTMLFNNMADSMSLNVRSVADDSSPGVATSFESVISVHWLWMTLPFALLALTFVYLITVVCVSRAYKQEPWKTSSMAVLMHSLQDDESRSLIDGIERLDDMENAAGHLKMKILRKNSIGQEMHDGGSHIGLIAR